MKKLFLLFAISTISLFAQEEELNLEGKYALQFQTGGFYLRDFQGATFSGKYHFTNNLALRSQIK